MGKPFKKELALVNETYNWAKSVELQVSQDIVDDIIAKPTYVVGSGGSFSACHMLTAVNQANGGFSKPVTPLELHYASQAIRGSNVIFLSASGKNSDILFAYKTAIKHDPQHILGVCMKKQTPLSELAKNHAISKILEFLLPSGKDGFLATNSLIAYFTLLPRMFGLNESITRFENDDFFLEQLKDFVFKLNKDFTLTVLYAGWGQPVAIDIESKFTEAGLGNVLLSDFRNFGHGRHNWFDKKKPQSAIVALITPQESLLAEKTLSLLPDHIPRLRISTNHKAHIGTIDLLIKAFSLVSQVGEQVGIDPGRPGVPSYGSKLYNLRYQSILGSEKTNYVEINAILRKTRKKSFQDLDKLQQSYWKKQLAGFRQKVNSKKFGAVILDYDGTIALKEERATLPSSQMIEVLQAYTEKGFVLGIVTGRGKSIRENLQRVIDKKYWENVVLGYYNGGNLALLGDDTQPDTKQEPKKSLQDIYNCLDALYFPSGKPKLELRPLQLTIEKNGHCDWQACKNLSLEAITKQHYGDIQILESGHSIDVISKPTVGKLNIVEDVVKVCRKKGLSEDYLCIGDKGQYPGNDYELLTAEVSLSVDEVSSDPNTCWNLSEPGNRGVSTCLQYLQSITFHSNFFNVSI